MRRALLALAALAVAVRARRLRQRPAGLPDARPRRLHAPGGLRRHLARHRPAQPPRPGRADHRRREVDRPDQDRGGRRRAARRRPSRAGSTIGPDPLGDVSISLGVPALLALRVDDRADVDLSGLSAKSFELRVDGSGDVRARGRVDDLEMEVDGSASTDLGDLATQNASVRIDGSGDAELRVARSLELIVEGSGDVTYHGRPSVSSRLEGSGNVKQVDRLTTTTRRRKPGRRYCNMVRC